MSLAVFLMHANVIKPVFTSILLALFSFKALAQPTSEDACLLLGPTPSFIIKPSSQFILKHLNQHLKTTDIHFTHTHKIKAGYFLAYFDQNKQTLGTLRAMNRTGQHCYSRAQLKKIAQALQQNPMIEDVTPNFLSSVASYAEPDQNTQWNLLEAPGGIDLPQTWLDFTQDLSGITVAVIDTGLMAHQALSQNSLPGVFFINAGDYGVSATPTCLECPGANHGTAVAGIIAATGELAYGQHMFGVSPQSKILPINVFTRFDDQETCGYPPCMYAYLSDQINALHWLMGQTFVGLPAAPKAIKAVNMSLGNVGDCPRVAQKTFEQAQVKGPSVVVASGNQNINAAKVYPANCTGVISVAATGRYGEGADYSNWGETITLSAPGGNREHSIYSTAHDSYRYLQGTSVAAPHVTGVIALMYAMNPTLDALSVKEIIASKETTTAFPAYDDINVPKTNYGVGILNAYKAIAKAKTTLRGCPESPSLRHAHQ